MSGFGATSIKAFVRRHGGAVMGSITSTTSDGVVYTLDDGPDPSQTQLVLDSLADHDATATFFVLLTRVRAHGTLLDEILSAGHEVALHGADHRALTRFGHIPAHRRTADARAELEDRIGRRVRWYRPPYGKQNPLTWLAVRRAGLVPVLWNGTTGDSQPHADAERRRRIEASATRGAIVLAHDGIAGPADGVHDPTAPLVERAALTDAALDVYDERGLRVRSLADALAAGARPVTTLELTQFRRDRRARTR